MTTKFKVTIHATGALSNDLLRVIGCHNEGNAGVLFFKDIFLDDRRHGERGGAHEENQVPEDLRDVVFRHVAEVVFLDVRHNADHKPDEEDDSSEELRDPKFFLEVHKREDHRERDRNDGGP